MIVGTLDAESDDEFLKDCFIKTPQYEDLNDFNNNKMILLGRTGVGKTALIRKLELIMSQQNGYFIKIKPDFIGLQYLVNNTLVTLRETIPNSSIIYKAIWLHKIAVCIIESVYGDKNAFLKTMDTLIKGNKEEKKLYTFINDFEHTFFESDQNLFESEKIKTVLKPKLKGFELGSYEKQNTKEVQTEVTQFINQDLIKNLENILELIRKDLSKDDKKKIIIAIDDLDTDWAIDDKTKYELIAALIQTVRFFSTSKNYSSTNNFKLVVAIRTDLYKKACEEQKTVQTEKMDSLTTGLYWDENSLKEMLMARLKHSYQYHYSKKTTIKIDDLFIDCVEQESTLDYLIARTMLRPRDLIQFVNFCFEESKGEKVELSHIKEAESRYKTSRHEALTEEWASSYPELAQIVSLTRKELGNQFQFKDVLNTLNTFTAKIQKLDNINDALCLYFADDKKEPEEKAYELVKILYLVGIVGILNQDTLKFDFVSHKKPTLKNEIIEEFSPSETYFKIHPLFEIKEARLIG